MRIVSLTKEAKDNILEDLLKRSPNNYDQYQETVNEILNDDARNCLAPGGRVVDIAVLFVDVRGFTTMSVALSFVLAFNLISSSSSCRNENPLPLFS